MLENANEIVYRPDLQHIFIVSEVSVVSMVVIECYDTLVYCRSLVIKFKISFEESLDQRQYVHSGKVFSDGDTPPRSGS